MATKLSLSEADLTKIVLQHYFGTELPVRDAVVDGYFIMIGEEPDIEYLQPRFIVEVK